MSDTSTIWTPPSSIEELYKATNGNEFSGINQPTSGARDDRHLPTGDADIQLYSLATPNGQKVSILFEELIEAGCDLEYDAFLINIGAGEQFSAGFTQLNPNGKIPACLDRKGPNGKAIRLFESGSICLYFAEKYSKFIPEDPSLRLEMMNWIFWQMGSQGPMSGQFGHFFVYAPDDQKQTRDYGTSRYGMETQRLCDVLDKHLADKDFMLGNSFSLADIMVFPWFYQVMTGYKHKSDIAANTFLQVDQYRNALIWAEKLLKRPGVDRGLQVCSWWEKEKGTKPWLQK